MLTVKKPSGQRMRRSSGSPALLEGSEQSLALVTEAKARKLLVLGDGGLATQFAKAEYDRAGRPARRVVVAWSHPAPTTRSRPPSARSANR